MHSVWFVLASVVWPAAVVGAMLIWPGPIATQIYEPQRSGMRSQAAQPPVDRLGSTSIFSSGTDQGTTAIFWEIPKEGTVRMVIEFDPGQSDEEGLVQEELPVENLS